MYIPHCVYPFLSGFLGCFHLLAAVNNMAVNVGVQMWVFVSLLSVHLSIYPEVELLDHMVSTYNFLKNCYRVSHSGYTILCSYQQCTRAPISPHPHQHLLSVLFTLCCVLNNSHPNGCEVVAHCGFLNWAFCDLQPKNIPVQFQISFH